jgi:hypothetical protein
MYSELDKTLDNCFYVFTNDGLSAANQLKMGSCKARRHTNIPATVVTINPLAGMVVDDRVRDVPVNVSVAVTANVIPARKKEPGVIFSFMKPK